MPYSLDLSEDFRLPFLTSAQPNDRLPRFVREHSRLFRLRHRFASSYFRFILISRSDADRATSLCLSPNNYYLASSSTWAFLSRTHRHSVTIKGIYQRYITYYPVTFLAFPTYKPVILVTSRFIPERFYGFSVLLFYYHRIFATYYQYLERLFSAFSLVFLHYYSIIARSQSLENKTISLISRGIFLRAETDRRSYGQSRSILEFRQIGEIDGQSRVLRLGHSTGQHLGGRGCIVAGQGP